MPEHILFLTGTLAEPALRRVLRDMGEAGFTWEVRALGAKVAALLTADMIRRRLGDTGGAARVILPGRCRGDLQALGENYGVPFQRGPDELRDLPEWFGRGGGPADLSRHRVSIFAEVVDAPQLSPRAILARAQAYRGDGADVIDLGCLPDVDFGHLEESVRLLKDEGFTVSVDSMREDELLRGGHAGADYLLSLTRDSLWIADQVAATPVLIPQPHGDLDSLVGLWEELAGRGRDALLDPILDPIHFGFTESVLRYRELRRRLPEARVMMGVGNLTELTEADTNGINALLFGIISELELDAVLTTQVSPHCRSAVREADLARRIMYRARADAALPKRYHGGLTGLHERKPFPYSTREIRDTAAQVKDRNYRIQVNADGIHLFNRDGLHSADDPYQLYPRLELDGDTGHAFYLGLELGRAEIAHRLGKRYVQDRPLDWGAALPAEPEDLLNYAQAKSTKGTGAKD